MNRKIEAGCLAVIHGLVNHTEFNGVSVEVVKKAEYGEWIKDSNSQSGVYSDQRGGWLVTRDDWLGVEPFGEKHLLRIDDYTEKTETQEEEFEV